MTSDAVTEDVIAIIRNTCAPDEPDVSDHKRPLLESGLDSLDFASVLMALEDKYSVKLLDDADVESIQSIDEIVRRIKEAR